MGKLEFHKNEDSYFVTATVKENDRDITYRFDISSDCCCSNLSPTIAYIQEIIGTITNIEKEHKHQIEIIGSGVLLNIYDGAYLTGPCGLLELELNRDAIADTLERYISFLKKM